MECNANVRASVREGRGGEVSRVWEWIGSVGFLEDGPGAVGGRRRESSRLSLGSVDTGVGSSPVVPVSAADGGREVERRRWDEGRPIY